MPEAIIYKDEADVRTRVEAVVLEHCRTEAEAAGRMFDPRSHDVRRRVEEAVAESLDELGFFEPPR
jgi:hypothetical protein